MTQANANYVSSGAKWAWIPNKFKPDNKPLLSKSQWQKMQLGLNDMVALYSNILENQYSLHYFPPETLQTLKELSEKANNFRNEVIVKGSGVAGNLKNYANNSATKYKVLVNVLDHHDLKQQVAATLLKGLVDPAERYEAQARELEQVIVDFNNYLGTALPKIRTGLKIVKENIKGSEGDMERVSKDIAHQGEVIHTAQQAILSDKNTIKDTLKYMWAVPIGTIIAIVKLVESEKDIQTQWGFIQDATKQLEKDVKELSQDALTLAELTFAEQSFERAITDINDVHQGVGKMAGTWSNIFADLRGIVDNLNKHPESHDASVDMRELDEVSNLTAAENQWLDIENIAEDFLANFHLSAA